LRVIGGLALLTPAVLLVHGYHPLADDGAVYITGIKKLANPGLYQSDAVFALSPTHLSVFAHVLAPLLRWVPLAGVLLVCQLASIFLFLLGSWRVAGKLFSSERARWGAVLLAGCCFTLPVAGTSLSIMDPYVTARSLSMPLSLFALAAVLEEDFAWCGFWIALAGLLHPLMAGYSAIAMLTVAICQRRLWRPLGLVYGLGFLLCAATFFATYRADHAFCLRKMGFLIGRSACCERLQGEIRLSHPSQRTQRTGHPSIGEGDGAGILVSSSLHLLRARCLLLKNKSVLLWAFRGESRGIPHLAKNERDVGHPAVGGGDGFKSVFPPAFTYPQNPGLKSETWATHLFLSRVGLNGGGLRGFALGQAALSRSYFFLSSWEWYEYLGLLIPLLLLGAAGANTLVPWSARALAMAATVMGGSALLISLCFVHRSGSLLLARMQVLRGFQFVYAAGVLLAGGLVTKLRPRTMAALYLVLAGALFAGQRLSYPESNHVEWPGLMPRNGWQQAFLWIRSETPGNAIFALDNDYIESPGEDAQGFRAIAERSAVPDWFKDGGIASNFPQAAVPWWQGSKATEHLNSATDEQRLERLKPFGATWIVLPAEASTGFPCPFINARVRVCRVAVSHADGAK
jgi:hypothetical protein